MSMSANYELVIIGAGAAGLTGAPFAVRLGARTALVERDRIGGDCTWTGCVPSKTLVKTARLAHQMRTAGSYGLLPVEPRIDFNTIKQHLNRVIDVIYQPTSPESLREKGMEVILGEPHFQDAHHIAINGQTITTAKTIICTGAHPFVPQIPGLDSLDYLTYLNIWELKEVPKHMIVVGAGAIGCELAQAFGRLGAQITLIEANERISEDPDVAGVIAEQLTSEGIDIRRGSTADRVWQDQQGIHVDAGGSEITGDALLIAVGRRPNVDNLDLEKAGIKYSEKGIQVNRYLRTSQGDIYAAGDCAGSMQFSHYAGWQAFMAVRNALLPGNHAGFSDQVPWCIFTDPEVAHVGLTEEQAQQKFGNTVLTYMWPMSKVDRALNEGESKGFLKLVYHEKGNILGVTIVAAQAGEMINEWVVAMKEGFKIDQLVHSIHVYPSFSMATLQATEAIRVDRLLSGLKGKIIKIVARTEPKE
jgi:pyruvate/2-oxoglutarate dehydrogenase complex dihydrolipoamide dehydrogenase (E3) component